MAGRSSTNSHSGTESLRSASRGCYNPAIKTQRYIAEHPSDHNADYFHRGPGRRLWAGRADYLFCMPAGGRSNLSQVTELMDVSGAFGYGDQILIGDRVRLRGVREDDLPALAGWEMDPGRLITLSNWVALPSEAAARERIVKRSANEEDDLGFAIETLDDPPVLVGRIWLSVAGAPARTGGRRPGSLSVVSTSVVGTARTRCVSLPATGSARWACTAFSSGWPCSTPPESAPMRRRGS